MQEWAWAIIWGGAVAGGISLALYQKRVRGAAAATPEALQKNDDMSPVIATVLRQYDELSERDLGAIEHELLKHQPRSTDRFLVYALRVSKCVPTLKTITKLPRRWEAAHFGPRGTGGILATDEGAERNAVVSFLQSTYLQRLHGLGAAICEANLQRIAKARTNDARRRILESTERLIVDTSLDFSPSLPGAFEDARKMVDTFRKLSRCDDFGQLIEEDT